MSLEDFKRAWREMEIEESKRGFMEHLVVYIVINSFLIFVNLYVNPAELWFPWVLAGWGIGLALHCAFSRPRFIVPKWEEKVARIEARMKRLSSLKQE